MSNNIECPFYPFGVQLTAYKSTTLDYRSECYTPSELVREIINSRQKLIERVGSLLIRNEFDVDEMEFLIFLDVDQTTARLVNTTINEFWDIITAAKHVIESQKKSEVEEAERKRMEVEEINKKRTEMAERATYERLKAKYENDTI